jgi:hypothetical protein
MSSISSLCRRTIPIDTLKTCLPLLTSDTSRADSTSAFIATVSRTSAHGLTKEEPDNRGSTRAALPLLRRGNSPQAINLSSLAALSPDGIRVNSVHPGWVRTHMGSAAAPPGHENELVTVEAGAQPIVDLATSVAPTPTAKFLQREGELPR